MAAPEDRTDGDAGQLVDLVPDPVAGLVAGSEPDRGTATSRWDVIHVERAFSAQPTLSNSLGPAFVVHELPLPDTLACGFAPDLIWASDATADLVHLLRTRFPTSHLLATVPRTADPRVVLALLDEGTDLVLRDEGILLAAAALQSMARRKT
jgi:hypothetical protein